MQVLKTEIPIKNLRVFQSIKLGGNELTYLQNTKYELTYLSSHQIIIITDRHNPIIRAITPLANVPWMDPAEELFQEKPEDSESVSTDDSLQQETAHKNIKGSGKKKN